VCSKNWQKPHFFPQGRSVRQRSSLRPTLFNIYINELVRALEQSAAPGLTLLESEVKCLLFADDLVLLSPNKEGLQQHLDLLYRLCQTWALTVNLSKTKNNGVPKKVQLPGRQIQMTSRHRCPRTHKKLYIPKHQRHR
jgi:hypothetical protein